MRSMRPSNLMSLQFVTRRRRPLMAGVVEKSAYVELSAAMAKNQNAPLIHLNQIALSHYAGLSPQQIKEQYFTPADNTHSSPAGAELNAQSVLEGLRQLTNCPLAGFLKPDAAAK